MSDRIPRLLDAREIRVLGCLLEKQQATPDAYPMTVNALVAGCNQRSNRDPVMSLTERDVRVTLERLLQEELVRREESARSVKWYQRVEHRWNLNDPRKAALTVLLLRGPQTAGEVRTRTARLHAFDGVAAAEEALADLASPPEPLVELLEREPGQKEPRWMHRVGVEDVSQSPPPPPAPRPSGASREFDPERMTLRIERLEQQVRELEAALKRLRGATD